MDRYSAMRIFVKVAELQSFTQASEQLDLPQSTATAAVQELEVMVQAKLLNRTTRSVKLTSEGALFLERCKDALSEMDEMQSMFQLGSTQIQGKVRVDMTSVLARDVVIPRLPQFFEKHPDIEIEIVGSDQWLDLIREGIDCTIRYDDGELEPGLAAIELDADEMKIVNVVSPSYIKKFGKPKKLEDLKNHFLVHYTHAHGVKPEEFEYFDGQRSREIKMKSRITVATIDAYKAACLAGLGICQNPWIGVRDHLKRGELVEVLPQFRPESESRLRIVYPKRRFLAKRVRAFVEWVEPLLKEYFKR